MSVNSKHKTQIKESFCPKGKKTSTGMEKMALHSKVNAAVVISEYATPFGKLGLTALVDALSDSMGDVIEGDTKRCEAMLLGQAYALQSIFMNLSRRAAKQEHLKHYETFLKLGLKAQSQCRATLETLTMLKNPPIIYAKQANIAQGHQQINNGVMPSALTTHAEKNKLTQNELLERPDEQRLESRATHTASHADSNLEALATGNGAKN